MKAETVPVSEIQVCDIVKVMAGARIPVDGVVFSGTSTVDEASLTGESKPIKKSVGAAVSAGTINVGKSYMEVECMKTSEHSSVKQLSRLLKE